MPVQLRALHSSSRLNHLRARIITVNPAASRIDAHDVPLWWCAMNRRYRRKKCQQPAVFRVANNWRALAQSLLNDVQIEHALARGEKAAFRIFRVFLARAIAKVRAHLAAERNLAGIQAVL